MIIVKRGIMSTEKSIDEIAHECTRHIRHMDVIDYDPEGLRIKSLVRNACFQAFELAKPKPDGKSTHITTGRDVGFVVHGVDKVPSAWQGRPMEVPYAGQCAHCGDIHDPRGHYDHAAIPMKKLKARK